MEVLGISSVDEWPSHIPEDVWLLTEDERQVELDLVLSTIIKKFIDVSFNSTARPINNDRISLYAEQVLSIGSLHAEFTDAIREGDGTRVIRCWRYLMSYFIIQIERITQRKQLSCCININMCSRRNKFPSYCMLDLSTLAPILHQFDKVNDVMHHQTRHKAAKMNKDMLQMVKQLNKTVC